MVYLSIEGGLFGATGEIWPRQGVEPGWRECDCGVRFYSSWDWLCPSCRDQQCQEEDARAEQRQQERMKEDSNDTLRD